MARQPNRRFVVGSFSAVRGARIGSNWARSKLTNELVVVATGRRLALHIGLQPDAGGMFGYILRRHRIPEGFRTRQTSCEGEGAWRGPTVGVTDKMILMPQVQIPEDAMNLKAAANLSFEQGSS